MKSMWEKVVGKWLKTTRRMKEATWEKERENVLSKMKVRKMENRGGNVGDPGIIKREAFVQNLQLWFGIPQLWHLDGEGATTHSHLLRNCPCSPGVSIAALIPLPVLLFLLPRPPLSLCLRLSLECSSSPRRAQMKPASQDRQHISTTPEQPALKSERREGSFQLWRTKRKMWIDRPGWQREGRVSSQACSATSKLLCHFGFFTQVTICGIFISTQHPNVLRGVFLPIFRDLTSIWTRLPGIIDMHYFKAPGEQFPWAQTHWRRACRERPGGRERARHHSTIYCSISFHTRARHKPKEIKSIHQHVFTNLIG